MWVPRGATARVGGNDAKAGFVARADVCGARNATTKVVIPSGRAHKAAVMLQLPQMQFYYRGRVDCLERPDIRVSRTDTDFLARGPLQVRLVEAADKTILAVREANMFGEWMRCDFANNGHQAGKDSGTEPDAGAFPNSRNDKKMVIGFCPEKEQSSREFCREKMTSATCNRNLTECYKKISCKDTVENRSKRSRCDMQHLACYNTRCSQKTGMALKRCKEENATANSVYLNATRAQGLFAQNCSI